MMLENLLDYLRDAPTVPVVSLGVLLVIWYFTPKWNDKRPPCPWTRLPIIGNLIPLMRSKDKAYITMYKTSKKPEYDKLFMVKICGLEVCMVNHIEIVQEALLKKPLDFADRLPIYSLRLMTNGGKDILVGNYGPVWKLHRKVAHQAIRNFASGSRLEDVVRYSTTKAMEIMEQKADEPFIIKPVLELLVFNMLSGILFGKQYELDDPEFTQFKDVTQEGAELFGKGVLADIFPALSFVPFQGRKMLKFLEIYMSLLKARLQEHRESFDPDNLRDITDYLIHAQYVLEAEDEESRGMLTDEHLVYTLFDVFGAGIDTLNANLQFAVGNSIAYPETQEKLAAELQKVFGDREPTLKDRIKTPYTEAFMCEVLRHDSLVVFGFPPLATTCDTTLGKYELPKGTGVVINFWALHNDPDYWENPSDFRPERFLDDAGEIAQRPKSFMPFSSGKRVCLGENLSKSMLMMVLPMIFQRFKFNRPEQFDFGYEDIAFANIPKKYKVCIENR